ncbi:recombinase family protein [Paraburkholderia sp. SIMBA_049]
MQEIVSGASRKRPLREEIMQLALTRAVDVILVHALDRWARSVQDLILTRQNWKRSEWPSWYLARSS